MNQSQLIISVFLPLFAIIGIIIYLIFQHEKKRTEAFKNIAMQTGFTFKAVADKPNSDIELFNKGHSRKIYNAMKGIKNSIEIRVFEFRYTTHTGNKRHTYNQTVGLAKLDRKLPNFKLAPEYFFNKVGRLVGFTDINFSAYPKFSDRFRLKGKDKAAVKKLFTNDKIEFLEQKEGNFNIGGSNNDLIFYTFNKRIKPGELPGFIDEIARIAKLFDKK